MKKAPFTLAVLLGSTLFLNAQGTPGILKCSFNGTLDVHAHLDRGSAIIARVKCGDPLRLIDQQYSSPHIRTADGKDGYITQQNFGQWSIEATTTTAKPTEPPAISAQSPVNVQAPIQSELSTASPLVVKRASTSTEPQNINVRIVAANPTSPEGFVEDTSIWRVDSARDFQKSINRKCRRPSDKLKKSSPDLGSVCFTAVDGGEDVTIIVAARGENAQSLGQRTTMSFYNNVLVAESVPTVGVTRWVSIILSVGTYKKEFAAWSTSKSLIWSLGAWSQDADLLARNVMDWCLLNQEKLRQLR